MIVHSNKYTICNWYNSLHSNKFRLNRTPRYYYHYYYDLFYDILF